MSDILLVMTMPVDVAQAVEDLLLAHHELVSGFTANQTFGHGTTIQLTDISEQVRGCAPRVQIRIAGDEQKLREMLAIVKRELPRARVLYWLMPIIESGRL